MMSSTPGSASIMGTMTDAVADQHHGPPDPGEAHAQTQRGHMRLLFAPWLHSVYGLLHKACLRLRPRIGSSH
jgi:hypothetical protein